MTMCNCHDPSCHYHLHLDHHHVHVQNQQSHLDKYQGLNLHVNPEIKKMSCLASLGNTSMAGSCAIKDVNSPLFAFLDANIKTDAAPYK